MHRRADRDRLLPLLRPRRSTLLDLAWIAAPAVRIGECFQQAKTDAGLDHYQVRSWRAWCTHITLSMLALAWLTATRLKLTKGNQAVHRAHDQPGVGLTLASRTVKTSSVGRAVPLGHHHHPAVATVVVPDKLPVIEAYAR